MKDVVQSAEVFQETENEEPEWKELGASQMYLVSSLELIVPNYS